jgi:hypothetical protein
VRGNTSRFRLSDSTDSTDSETTSSDGKRSTFHYTHIEGNLGSPTLEHQQPPKPVKSSYLSKRKRREEGTYAESNLQKRRNVAIEDSDDDSDESDE